MIIHIASEAGDSIRFDKTRTHQRPDGHQGNQTFMRGEGRHREVVETAINKLGLSARAYSRVLKVGRTIADLAGAENIEAAHIAEAIQYRSLNRRM
jgi:magnesium chelatase family protein